MGKSVSGTLMGVLINRGHMTCGSRHLDPGVAVSGDPREDRIADILRMSSVPRIRARRIRFENGRILITSISTPVASTRSARRNPSAAMAAKCVGRYRNTDPVLTNYLIRLAIQKRNEDYHAPAGASSRAARWCPRRSCGYDEGPAPRRRPRPAAHPRFRNRREPSPARSP